MTYIYVIGRSRGNALASKGLRKNVLHPLNVNLHTGNIRKLAVNHIFP